MTAAVRAEQVDAIVFDPTTLGSAEWTEACSLLEDVSLPVLLYAPLSPTHAPRLVQASAVGVHEMLLRGVDDDPATMRRRLESLREPEPPAAVLSQIAPHMVKLPAQLQSVIVPLFCSARIPRWVEGVALAAGMPRRSIDRWMARAEIGGTATLLDVARLAAVWVPLVERREAAAASHLSLERASTYPDITVGVTVGREGATEARERLIHILTTHRVTHP